MIGLFVVGGVSIASEACKVAGVWGCEILSEGWKSLRLLEMCRSSVVLLGGGVVGLKGSAVASSMLASGFQ